MLSDIYSKLLWSGPDNNKFFLAAGGHVGRGGGHKSGLSEAKKAIRKRKGKVAKLARRKNR